MIATAPKLRASGGPPRVIQSVLPCAPEWPPPCVQALHGAAADPDRVAIVDGATGERVTGRDLARQSAALAASLAERGLGRGDLVAIVMPNLACWPVVALGVWRTGAALVPVSPFWTASEMERVLRRVRPALAVAFGPFAPTVREALEDAGIAAEIVVHRTGDGTPLDELLAAEADDAFAVPDLDPGQLAVVPFSSGTGGLPKGVRLTHGNLAASAGQVAVCLEGSGRFDATSVALAGAPFFHAMGLGLSLCAPLNAGARIVTAPVPDTERTLELIAEHGVTHATVRPPTVSELASDARVERYDTTALAFVGTGGAHVPPADAVRAGERLGALVRQGYGMTEAVAIAEPVGPGTDPAAVGWLAPGTEARLVDPEGGGDVAPGRPGELWIRGPQVMDGYYGDPEATAAALTPDGWLRTGDLVSIRDDAQLVVEDRLKELIKVGGASVAPAELELVLREHPSVRDAAVVGRPDPRTGEAPVGHVVLDEAVPAEELVAFVASRVAPYKCLRDVRAVGELPRLPSGKLQRRELRDRERRLAGVPAPSG